MMWGLKRVLKETQHLYQWRQKGEDIVVRGDGTNRTREMGITCHIKRKRISIFGRKWNLDLIF